MIRRSSPVLYLLNLLYFLCLTAMPGKLAAQVTSDQLLHSSDGPTNWLLYSGSYDAHRFSSLSQINRDNVSELAPQWVLQTSAPGFFEATPLVVDGVMYVTAPGDNAYALDARTGARL